MLFKSALGLWPTFEHDPWGCGGDSDDSGDRWGDVWRNLQGEQYVFSKKLACSNQSGIWVCFLLHIHNQGPVQQNLSFVLKCTQQDKCI